MPYVSRSARPASAGRWRVWSEGGMTRASQPFARRSSADAKTSVMTCASAADVCVRCGRVCPPADVCVSRGRVCPLRSACQPRTCGSAGRVGGQQAELPGREPGERGDAVLQRERAEPEQRVKRHPVNGGEQRGDERLVVGAGGEAAL